MYGNVCDADKSMVQARKLSGLKLELTGTYVT